MSAVAEHETVTVLWGGKRQTATVVKRFKNGKVRVQIGRARWTGGRPGSATDAPRVTVEPWQIVPEETMPTWSVPHEHEMFDLLHMRWDVAKAWALVGSQEVTDTIGVADAARIFGAPTPAAMLDKDSGRIYVGVSVDTDWCLTNDVDLTRPILVVQRPVPKGDPVTVIIDGYHRLFRAWHDGVESLPAILLTAAQERKVRLR